MYHLVSVFEQLPFKNCILRQQPAVVQSRLHERCSFIVRVRVIFPATNDFNVVL